MYGFIITTAGMDMLARAVLGEPITITGVQVGKGVVSDMETARALTSLISPVANGTSNTPKVSKTKISMVVEYRNDMNDGLTEAFDLHEFGIFAKISNQQPTLLYYATLGNAPHKVQPISAGLDVHRFPVTIEVTDDVVVTLGYPAGAFLTEDEKGSPGGVAELDENGVVLSEQMPGYTVISGPSAMGQACPGGPLKLDDIQGNTVLGGTPAYNAPVSMESVESPLRLHVAGKNLLQPVWNLDTLTQYGITCTRNGDAFVMSGTNSRGASLNFYINRYDTESAFSLPAGTYTLSGASFTESLNMSLSLYRRLPSETNESVCYQSVGASNGVSFTLSEDADNLFLVIVVGAGVTVDGVTITPQIEVGNEATGYEAPSNTTVEIPLLGTDGQALEPLRMSYIGRYGTGALPVPDRIIRKDGVWCVERNTAAAELTAATWGTSTNYLMPYLNGDSVRGQESHWVISTHFPPSGANPSTVWTAGIWMGAGLAINKESLPSGTSTTQEEMAAWCAAQAEAGTPVLVCYARTEPVYEELHQDVQVLLNTLAVPGGVCSVWFEGDVLPSGADIGFPRGDYPSAGLEGAYRWLEELSNPLPAPTTDDLYAWALSQQRGGVFATSGSTTTQNVPETGDLTGILSVTEQGSVVSMIVFGPTGKLYMAKRAAGVWRGWVQVYSDLTPPPLMGGAAASQAGSAGLVPAPAAGAQGKYLRGDGTWQMPQDTTYDDATQSAAGLLSSADKIKLDGIEAGANHYTHPSYTARSSGLYKIAVDETGHISGAESTHTGRAARFVVGTITAGWTAEDCDYLCDGTSDQTEINDAIAALPSGGGEVLLLDGTYNISSSITIRKAKVSLRGCGPATMLTRKFNGASANGVIGCSAANCTISHLTIDGNKGSFTNEDNRGVYASQSAADIAVEDVVVQNSRDGIYLGGMTGGRITRCRVTNSGAFGVFIYNATAIDISHNHIDATGETAVLINGGKSIKVDGNTITGSTNYGVRLFNDAAMCALSSNICLDNAGGISLESASMCNVSDNLCMRGSGSPEDYDSTKITIRATSASSNNIIAGNLVMGKDVEDSGTGNLVVNNKFE